MKVVKYGSWILAGLPLHHQVLEGLRDNPTIHRSIPLPPSNLTPAKSIRVAAGLSVYASALAKHIVRPTYILRDEEALETFAELTRHDP